MQLVWDKCLEYYRANPDSHRYNEIRISMFAGDETAQTTQPKLKGRGAEIKALGPALHAVWQHFVMSHANPSDQDEQIDLGLQTSCLIDKIMHDNKHLYKLPPDTAQQFEVAVWTFLNVQNALGKHYPAQGLKLFIVTPKSHYLAHMGLTSGIINPYLGTCWTGEDFMQKMKGIAGVSARGNNIYQVNVKTVGRYALGLEYTLRKDASG